MLAMTYIIRHTLCQPATFQSYSYTGAELPIMNPSTHRCWSSKSGDCWATVPPSFENPNPTPNPNPAESWEKTDADSLKLIPAF